MTENELIKMYEDNNIIYDKTVDEEKLKKNNDFLNNNVQSDFFNIYSYSFNRIHQDKKIIK